MCNPRVSELLTESRGQRDSRASLHRLCYIKYPKSIGKINPGMWGSYKVTKPISGGRTSWSFWPVAMENYIPKLYMYNYGRVSRFQRSVLRSLIVSIVRTDRSTFPKMLIGAHRLVFLTLLVGADRSAFPKMLVSADRLAFLKLLVGARRSAFLKLW